jgi:hypothetical protein
MYAAGCKKLYAWTSDESYIKSIAKTVVTLPASAVCAVGAGSWMGDYVQKK